MNDIFIYLFIWYNEGKIEGVVYVYIYFCWDFKVIGKNFIEDNEKINCLINFFVIIVYFMN